MKESHFFTGLLVIFLAFAMSGNLAADDDDFDDEKRFSAVEKNRLFRNFEGRITRLESAAMQTRAVDCASDPRALKNLELSVNTTYVLTGMCEGQIVVGAGLGTIGIEGDRNGYKDDGIFLPAGQTDADQVFAAIYGANGVRLNLSNLVINAEAYNSPGDLYISTVGSYRGAHVVLTDVDVIGGDEGLGAYNTGTFSVNDGVSVTGFRSAGLVANSASMVRVVSSITVTGGEGQEGPFSEAISAVNGGVIRVTGGGRIAPASGPNISTAQDTAAAVSAFRNGTVQVAGASISGSVWSGESSAVDLRNVEQFGGNIDAFRSGIIRVRGGSVTGSETDEIFAGVFSIIRMDNAHVGNVGGIGSISLYRYGAIDLRGNTDLNGRVVNCDDLRETRIDSSVQNVGGVTCSVP